MTMTDKIKQLITKNSGNICPHCNQKTNIEGHLHDSGELSIYKYCLNCDNLHNTLLTITKPSNESLRKINKIIQIEGL